ncbi:MAG: calcium-binding protein [Gemmataceae bacterium]
MSATRATLFAKLFRRPTKTYRRPATNRTRLGLTALEGRDLPAVTAVLANGVLTVTGTSGDDVISIVQTGNTIQTAGKSFAAVSVQKVVVNAGGGNDLIGVDSSKPMVLNGEAGNDTIYGGIGNDTISGGTGNDWIDAGYGDDRLSGDDGNDTLHGNQGNDSLSGGAGNDWEDGFWGFDAVAGDSGDDTLYGGEQDDTVSGGDGNDSLYGFSGNDILDGNDGNDYVFGDSGNDTLYGGAGNDTLDGFWGDDRLDGNDGNDNVYGGEGNDRMWGGPGNDYMDGYWGNDTIDANSGNDTVYAGEGNDLVYGGEDNDLIYGYTGNDTLYGGTGNDTLYGDAGFDSLYGEAGNDGLFAGIGDGREVLNGGAGDDRFLVLSGEDVAGDFDWVRDARITFTNSPALSGVPQTGQSGTYSFAAGAWTNADIQRVDVALANLQSQTGNTRLLKKADWGEMSFLAVGAQTDANTFRSGGWNNGGQIVYVNLPNTSDINVQRTVYHEFGHNWDEPSENPWATNFRAVSGWIESATTPTGYTASRGVGDNWQYRTSAAGTFARTYGQTNPFEDMGTTWEAYFVNKYHSATTTLTAQGLTRNDAKWATLDTLFGFLKLAQ